MSVKQTKFLFIRFSSIGDIILTSPLLRALKNSVPEAAIHYLTKKQFHEVIRYNPHIDKIHLFDGNYSQMIKDLRNESFDYIIDLHHSARSLRVKNSLKRLSFSFNKLNFKKWLLVNFKINQLPDIHIVDRYFETIKSFTDKDQQGLEFYFNENKINIAEDRLPFINRAYIAFAIGAKHNTKRMPVDKIAQFCDKIDCPVVLLGDKNDVERGENVLRQTKGKIFNACGKFNLHESAYLLKKAKLVVTHDSGLMHIAAAFEKKIISIWGNTVPEFGMYPYMPQNQNNYSIMEVKDLGCRPCSKIGYEKCPKKHFKCMKDIAVDELVKVSNAYLKK